MGKKTAVTTVLALATSILMGGQDVRAATYYVATTGSDSNPGTQASPFATVNKGIAAAAAGDTIILANGTYHAASCSGGSGNLVTINKSGAAGAPITLKALNHLGAILDGQQACYAVINFTTGNYWVIEDLDITGGYWAGISNINGGGSNTIIKHNVVRNIGNRYNNNNYAITGIFLNDPTTNTTVDGNVLHDIGPTSSGTGDPAHDHSIYLHGSNVNIVNNIFYNGYNGPFINVGSAAGNNYKGVIANNVFYGYSISWYYIDGAIYFNGSGMAATIDNNIFYNVRTLAINGDAPPSAPCSVSNNIVFNAAGTTAAGAAKLINTTPSACAYAGNKVNVDPKVVSAPTYNFHLQSGSPAIGAGLPLSSVSIDFDGVARPSIPDIGAFQFASGGTAPPPAASLAVSGVTATGISAAGATIGWTTNVSADGQVVYGLTSAYGSATALNSTLSTSHSFTLSALAGGTLYHYAVKSRDSAGNLVTSPDATFTTTALSAPAGCAASAGTWQNLPVTSQTGVFTAQFDVTPGAAAIDGVSGVSNGGATAWSSLAAAVRFNNTGHIDARNGGAYAAATSVPYVSGMTYHVRLVVNTPSHSYSAYVKQGSNAEQLVGSNYAFRTEQASVKTLNNVGVFTDAGTITTCSASAAGTTATTISALSATGIGGTTATIGWTTNNPADSQVQYGLTSAYGNTTTLNSTQVTSHSVSLGGLTAGTVYHYRAMSRDAAGTLATSPDATFTTSSTPPAISAVSASGVTASAATIGWTTDKPATSQVVYGPASTNVTVISAGSIYTLSSAVSSSLTTTHSVALSGLTASTLYHYEVKSADTAGNLTTSPDATFTTTASGGTTGGTTGGTNGSTSGGTNASTSGGTPTACMTSAGTWQNSSVPSLKGTFTAEFDGTASALTTDGVAGLSNGPATAFTSLGVVVRFNNSGKIDARNGGAYTAASSIAYKAGTPYHFRLVINLTAHTYSAYVKQGSNAEILIGSNYAFRTEQRYVTALTNLGAYADAGSIMVCNGTTHL